MVVAEMAVWVLYLITANIKMHKVIWVEVVAAVQPQLLLLTVAAVLAEVAVLMVLSAVLLEVLEQMAVAEVVQGAIQALEAVVVELVYMV
jgi:hypothetical protein